MQEGMYVNLLGVQMSPFRHRNFSFYFRLLLPVDVPSPPSQTILKVSHYFQYLASTLTLKGGELKKLSQDY